MGEFMTSKVLIALAACSFSLEVLAVDCRVFDSSENLAGLVSDSGDVTTLYREGEALTIGYLDRGGNFIRIRSGGNEIVGSLDLLGNILDAERVAVGGIDSEGSVFRNIDGQPIIGKVTECDLSDELVYQRAASGAFLFLFLKAQKNQIEAGSGRGWSWAWQNLDYVSAQACVGYAFRKYTNVTSWTEWLFGRIYKYRADVVCQNYNPS